jgi:hypothetical protein
MKTQETISSVLGFFVIIVAAYFLFSISGQYFTLKKQQIKNEAINGCMQVSGYSEITSGTVGKSSYPLKDIYTLCLQDKGYTTNWR